MNTSRLVALLATVMVPLSLWAPRSMAAFPHPAISKRAMVVSAHPKATDAGLQMLREGGNAVDAAVASAFAISVTLPYSAGLGGGGFALVAMDGKATSASPSSAPSNKVEALDFRERAPLSATRNMYVDANGKVRGGLSTDGYLSVAVPGTVAGLYALHQRHGKLPWRDVVGPAIDLAYNGFVLGERWNDAWKWRGKVLSRTPESAQVFTKNGVPYQAGDLFIQRDLARSLRLIAVDPQAFYKGAIAQAITSQMRKKGGLVTSEDLLAYKPTWRQPICGQYRGNEVCSMPPPSSGGVHLIQMLHMLEDSDVGAMGWHNVDTVARMVETMRVAYADRAVHLGDPAFHDVPVAMLTSRAYAKKRRAEIDPKKARRSSDVAAIPKDWNPKAESKDTSHLVVVDEDGSCVSLTFTVNYGFGSGVVIGGTGILMNDEMDDFSAQPGTPNTYGLVGGEANSVAPAKIPLSSMTPTIVRKGGKLFFATGSPGGSTIITTVLQVVLNIVDYKMDAAAAVAAPRLHHQWLPDVVMLERYGFDALTKAELLKRGFVLKERDPWGNASAIVVRKDGTLEGGIDPRGQGTAAGL